MSSALIPGENTKAIGILCALTVVALFAGFTLVSRLGFTTALTVPDIAMLRFGIAGLLLFPVLLKYGLGTLKWHQAAGLAFTGGLGFALLAYTGFRLAPASHGAVLLHGTIPLFTFVIVYWTLREAVKRAQKIGLVLILAGIIAMAWDSLSAATPMQLAGDGALLLAAICWSVYGVTVKTAARTTRAGRVHRCDLLDGHLRARVLPATRQGVAPRGGGKTSCCRALSRVFCLVSYPSSLTRAPWPR